jgi:hypothetical protein
MKRKKKAVPSEKKLIEVYGKFHPRNEMSVKTAEIVPASETAIVSSAPSANLEALIEGLVRRRVDEAISRIGIGEFDPHFRPREVAAKARQIQNMFEREKFSLYFEKWGCMICSKKTVHASNGHCTACVNRITSRLRQIKGDYEKAHPEAEIERQINHLTLRARTAEGLLRGEQEK